MTKPEPPIELLPCPFCGGKALMQSLPMGDGRFIRCQGPYAKGCGVTINEREIPGHDIITYWNNRMESASPANSSDISLNELPILRHMANECGGLPGCLICYGVNKEREKQQMLGAPVPVTVSLEKCADAAQQAMRDTDSWQNDDMTDIAKAVLNAAGVKYHED